jgi:hypothetical protein
LLQLCVCVVSESCELGAYLVVDFDAFALVLPLGELLVVELLLEFGLHAHQLVLLGAALVDELLGSTARRG